MAQPYAIVEAGARLVEKKGTSKSTGKDYHFFEQEVFVQNGRGERKIMRVTVDPGKEYAPGDYDFDLNFVGFIRDARGYEQLGFTRLVLVPRRKAA